MECREAGRFQLEGMTPDSRRLEQFELALAVLPPRILVPKQASATATAGKKKTSGAHNSFWADSVVRPFIAENLCQPNGDWFDNFVHLMVAADANGTPLRKRLAYPDERRGLQAMTDRLEEQGYKTEAALVHAVHQAISITRRKIKRETQPRDPDGPPSSATLARQDRYMERVRLDLVNAKNGDQAQDAICKLFRATRGFDNGLQNDAWRLLLPMLTDPRCWKKARNLALVALASWGGKRQSGGVID